MLRMIHDLDDFLYPAFPDAMNIMGNAAAAAAVEDCGLKVSVAYARLLIDRAIKNNFDWMTYLEQEGVDLDQLHDAYHKRLDQKLIKPYASLSKYFAELGSQASHVMLTHSNADWAGRAVDHIGLRPWFPENRILTWEKYKASKASSVKGFEMAANMLEADPREITFGDDNLRNLKTAKEMGMTTVWASHGRPLPAGQKQYVDHMVGNVEIFLQQQIAVTRKGMKP